MKWKLLSQDRCPKCDHRLERTNNGYECTAEDPYYHSKCGFFITTEKMKEMKAKLRRQPVNPQP